MDYLTERRLKLTGLMRAVAADHTRGDALGADVRARALLGEWNGLNMLARRDQAVAALQIECAPALLRLRDNLGECRAAQTLGNVFRQAQRSLPFGDLPLFYGSAATLTPGGDRAGASLNCQA